MGGRLPGPLQTARQPYACLIIWKLLPQGLRMPAVATSMTRMAVADNCYICYSYLQTKQDAYDARRARQQIDAATTMGVAVQLLVAG